MKKGIISIDLGSNSFRVLKYDCLNHKIIDDYHEVVGLADGLIQTQKISNDAQNRVVDAILESIKKLDYNPKEAVCVTTAAMRKAKNSKEVLDYFYEKTGLTFEIIDGKEEARLTLLAIKYALKRENINSSKFILLDIGGGSTEIIINDEQNFTSKSFDFGIVTMTQKYLDEKQLHTYLEQKKALVHSFLAKHNFNDLSSYTFVATAGTPTTIAAMKLGQDFFSYDRNVVNGTIVNVKDLETCFSTLKNSSKEDIVKLVGKGRVEFIEIGILIYKMIFEVLKKTESLVLDDGLREGVAINHCLKCKA